MEKQIEEMAKAIEQARIKATDTTNSMNYGFGGWYAKELYDKGYRKATDVAKDLFADIGKLVSQYSILDISASPVATFCEIASSIREVKKKYTEEGK